MLREKRPPVPLGKAKGALARFVVHHEQIVDFPEGARRRVFVFSSPAFGAAHQYPSPPIRRGVADRAEQEACRTSCERDRALASRLAQEKNARDA